MSITSKKDSNKHTGRSVTGIKNKYDCARGAKNGTTRPGGSSRRKKPPCKEPHQHNPPGDKASTPLDEEEPECSHGVRCPHGKSCTRDGHLHFSKALDGYKRRKREEQKSDSEKVNKPPRFKVCPKLRPSECEFKAHSHCPKDDCPVRQKIITMVVDMLNADNEPGEAVADDEPGPVPQGFMHELASYHADDQEERLDDHPPNFRAADYADLVPNPDHDDSDAQNSDEDDELPDDHPIPVEVKVPEDIPLEEIEPIYGALLHEEPEPEVLEDPLPEEPEPEVPVVEIVEEAPPPAFADELLANGLWELAAHEWIQPNHGDRNPVVVHDDLNNQMVVPALGGDEVTSVIDMGPHPQFPTKDVLIFFQVTVGTELTPITTRIANFFRRHVPFTTLEANMMVNDTEGGIPEFLRLTQSNAGRVSWWWAKNKNATQITPNHGHYTSFSKLYPSCQSGVVYSDMLDDALRSPELYTILCIDAKGRVMKSVSSRVQSWIARNNYLERDIGIVTTTTLCIVNQLVARSILLCGVLPSSSELDFQTKGVACPTRAQIELRT